MIDIPSETYAIQLVGPDQLTLNAHKPVKPLGKYQIRLRTCCVGLCFSDLKLLHQFAEHPRKSRVIEGCDQDILEELPSYAPDDAPTVPGHELVAEVGEVGAGVEGFTLGQRLLIQPDFRKLKTAGSNAACGYNFEGGLQDFLVLDVRLLGRIGDPDCLVMPVAAHLGNSEVALVEPWACVENSYVANQRTSPLNGGRLLVLAETHAQVDGALAAYRPGEGPASQTVRVSAEADERHVAELPDEAFDDIIVFGAHRSIVELCGSKLGKNGVLNLVLGGQNFGEPVTIGVGKIHYFGTRWIGTQSTSPVDSYSMLASTGEVSVHDSVLVMGAGGPMGQMHVLRCLAEGVRSVTASDLDEPRLKTLLRKAGTPSNLKVVRDTSSLGNEAYTYISIMAPIPSLVVEAIRLAAPKARINLFAGIPIGVSTELDLDLLIAKQLYVFGTSGSEPEDMAAVLAKLTRGSLNTNASVGAVTGIRGALDGLKAVETRTIDGKIVVYPELRDLPLTRLTDLSKHFPSVASKLKDGNWTNEAEAELLRLGRS